VGGDDLQLARKQPAMNDSSWPNTALSAVPSTLVGLSDGFSRRHHLANLLRSILGDIRSD